MKKASINLLQAELIPEQPLWTLKRVVSVWSIALLLMLSWLFMSQYQLTQLSNEFKVVKQQKQQQDNLLVQLEIKVSQNKADAVLQEKLETTKLLLLNKKALHKQLTDTTSTYAAGFSSAMTELSQLHHQDVSLKKVQMKPKSMTFSGLARKPEAVPAWLAAFEGSTFLAGQTFNHFSLNENEDKVTEFTVSSHKLSEHSGG
ncbi:PilN domain-containing protein [Colwelliaceae bacterium 6441]